MENCHIEQPEPNWFSRLCDSEPPDPIVIEIPPMAVLVIREEQEEKCPF